MRGIPMRSLVAFRAVIAVSVAAFVGAFLYLSVAPAAQAWTQPYGGCKEAWQAPQSQGAVECRAHGWIISREDAFSPREVTRLLSRVVDR